MAFQNTRQIMAMEDGFLGGAPLNGGLMGLPGANTTIANPIVATQLANPMVNPDSRFDPTSYENLSSRFFGRADGPARTVEDLYSTVLGRASDPGGLKFWTNKLGPTVDQNEFQAFYNAAQPELTARGRSKTPVTETNVYKASPVIPTNPDVAVDKVITSLDDLAKGAPPTVSKKPATEVVDSGKTVTQVAADQALADQLFGFDTSGFKSGTNLEDVYQQFLKRTGDIEGLKYWAKQIGPTVETNELERFLAAAAPERERVSKLTTPDVISVKDLYNQALGRTNVSPEELAYWQRQFGRDISPAEVERFLASAKKELDTSKYTPFSATADTSTFPKFEGRTYNPAAYENLVDQLSGQQKVLESKGFKYGSTFGDAQATVQDVAKRLASLGISSIYDLGMKHELPVEKVYETVEQDEGPSMQFDTGKYRTISKFKGYDNENSPIFEYRELTPEEVKKLNFDKSGAAFLPIGMAKQSELMDTPYATTKYYNKKTGEELDTRKIGSKAESGLFASSGAGDGYTNYRVVYTDDGTPVVLPEKKLSGMKDFIANDLSGIMSVLRFIPGAQIPLMLTQLAAGAYMGAKPEDMLKQAATSLIASNMDKLLPAGLEKLGMDLPTSDLGKLAMKAGSSGLATLVQGGDFEQALKSAGMSAAASGIASLLPDLKSGTINYEKVLQALAPALARGELTNADVFRLMGTLIPAQEKTPGKP